MKITIESPDGPRPGAMPMGGLCDEAALVKALLVTLACECANGQEQALLRIALDGIDAKSLLVIARSI